MTDQSHSLPWSNSMLPSDTKMSPDVKLLTGASLHAPMTMAECMIIRRRPHTIGGIFLCGSAQVGLEPGCPSAWPVFVLSFLEIQQSKIYHNSSYRSIDRSINLYLYTISYHKNGLPRSCVKNYTSIHRRALIALTNELHN